MPDSPSGFHQSTDGERVFCRAWERSEPAGSVLFVHGLGEHAGRYDHLARVVREAGLNMYAADLRGHGQSEGRRGHVPEFACLLRDLERLRERAAERTGSGLVLLVGHSLGGLVAGRYVQAFDPEGLRGLALVAPFVDVGTPVPAWKRILGRVTDRLLPELTLDNGLDVEQLFRLQGERDRYTDDPLVHRRISARLWGEMQRAARRLEEDAPGVRVPVLLQLAGRDTVVSNPAARRFADRLALRPEVIEYDEALHALYFDPDAAAALADLKGWIERRLADEAGNG